MPSNNNSQLSNRAPTRARTRVSTRTSQTSWTGEEDELLSKLMKENVSPDKLPSHFQGKTQQQIVDRWNKVLNPELVKGSWTTHEDEIIIKWVNEHGPRNWSTLASQLPGRLGKQCRERWVNNLSPQLSKDPWSEAEDKILIEYQSKWGNKWAKIAALLPGRTDNAVKNRWNSSLKRKLQRIANGEAPVNKRGRKPKRPSMAPDVTPQPQPVTPEISITGNETENSLSPNISNGTFSASSTLKFEQLSFDPRIDNDPIPRPDFSSYESGLLHSTVTTPCDNSPMIFSPIMARESPFFNSIWSPNKSPIKISFDANDGDKGSDFSFKH